LTDQSTLSHITRAREYLLLALANLCFDPFIRKEIRNLPHFLNSLLVCLRTGSGAEQIWAAKLLQILALAMETQREISKLPGFFESMAMCLLALPQGSEARGYLIQGLLNLSRLDLTLAVPMVGDVRRVFGVLTQELFGSEPTAATLDQRRMLACTLMNLTCDFSSEREVGDVKAIFSLMLSELQKIGIEMEIRRYISVILNNLSKSPENRRGIIALPRVFECLVACSSHPDSFLPERKYLALTLAFLTSYSLDHDLKAVAGTEGVLSALLKGFLNPEMTVEELNRCGSVIYKFMRLVDQPDLSGLSGLLEGVMEKLILEIKSVQLAEVKKIIQRIDCVLEEASPSVSGSVNFRELRKFLCQFRCLLESKKSPPKVASVMGASLGGSRGRREKSSHSGATSPR
jgi:hypothetical protein